MAAASATPSIRRTRPIAIRRRRNWCGSLHCAASSAGTSAWRNSPSDGYEADDLIGTLAALCRDAGLPVTLVSRDKDLAQLIGPRDVFWDYSDAAEYRYHEIAARFGVCPERMADYLALRGDSVDNVPGVPGVGAKTAAVLMSHCESLDHLFERLDAVAQLPLRGAARLQQRLREHRDAAYLARSLTRIVCDVPMSACHSDLQRRSPDLALIRDFCNSQGFGTLLHRQAERIGLTARNGAGEIRPS